MSDVWESKHNNVRLVFNSNSGLHITVGTILDETGIEVIPKQDAISLAKWILEKCGEEVLLCDSCKFACKADHPRQLCSVYEKGGADE